jgi:hypothetical protein
MHRLDRRDTVQRVLGKRDFPLLLMGDGIKVVLTFIPEETLNILGFILELLSIHGIKVETWFDWTATQALGAVNLRALNALSPVIN